MRAPRRYGTIYRQQDRQYNIQPDIDKRIRSEWQILDESLLERQNVRGYLIRWISKAGKVSNYRSLSTNHNQKRKIHSNQKQDTFHDTTRNTLTATRKGQPTSACGGRSEGAKVSDSKPSYRIRLLRTRSHFQTDQHKVLVERHVQRYQGNTQELSGLSSKRSQEIDRIISIHSPVIYNLHQMTYRYSVYAKLQRLQIFARSTMWSDWVCNGQVILEK